jgi:hypothetical protein
MIGKEFEHVRTRASPHQIVSRAAAQRVVAGVTIDHVVAVTT